eukprot:TRINITY_DN4970_c0_g1_i1.p2 TRINITY_DN4970_c0_g1~~TRINITY_DN4970_c0_g1_i1.p2  ORF type:complete len:299 (+),score=41.59 TRINITY_DN4970_c0_g1_i1:1090-1986(+)
MSLTNRAVPFLPTSERYGILCLMICAVCHPILIPAVLCLLMIRFFFSGLLASNSQSLQWRCSHQLQYYTRATLAQSADAGITGKLPQILQHVHKLKQRWRTGQYSEQVLPSPVHYRHLRHVSMSSGALVIGTGGYITDLHSGANLASRFDQDSPFCVYGNRMVVLKVQRLQLLSFPDMQLLAVNNRVSDYLQGVAAFAMDAATIVVVGDRKLVVYNHRFEVLHVGATGLSGQLTLAMDDTHLAVHSTQGLEVYSRPAYEWLWRHSCICNSKQAMALLLVGCMCIVWSKKKNDSPPRPF